MNTDELVLKVERLLDLEHDKKIKLTTAYPSSYTEIQSFFIFIFLSPFSPDVVDSHLYTGWPRK